MIFKGVKNIVDNRDKSFFKEYVSIYIRLVDAFCERNNLELIYNKNIEIEKELIELGVIENISELSILKKILGKTYEDFISSVKFTIENREIMNGVLDKLYNSERFKMQEKSKDISEMKLVDLFCGAGGLSLGFLQEGFNVKLANDIEDVCIETYRYNHPQLSSDKVVKGDIKEIIENLEDYISDEIDIVVGGPPCQGFSEANRQRVIDDPRNKLYKYFIEAVEKIAPKFVVMENVKGMIKVADQVIEDFEKLSIFKNDFKYTYKAEFRLLNSSDFSVAQNRDRLIYIAIRDDVIRTMDITPERLFNLIDENNKKNVKYVLRDALDSITPLEAPRIKNTTEIDSEVTGKKISVNYFSNMNNDYLSEINQKREIEYIFNHKARYCNDINHEIYRRLNQGDDATNEKISDIMPYSHRNHCFKDKYYKLIANKPSRTITAHLRMDCHSHIHPYQVRSITPREAARIQSFPDDYLFIGPYLKTYMQIGNAVPPMMARAIAKEIKKFII